MGHRHLPVVHVPQGCRRACGFSRDGLNITQKSAYFMPHPRLREAWSDSPGGMLGPVEVDETFLWAVRKRTSTLTKRSGADRRGTVGKMIVVGAKDRETEPRERFAVVPANTDAKTLQGFVGDHAAGRRDRLHATITAGYQPECRSSTKP